MRTLLFDADMLIYRMCAACEERSPFNKEILLKADPEETWRAIELRVSECLDFAQAFFEESVEVVMCLSPIGKTFRYDVDENYKANRKGVVKPVLLGEMRNKLFAEYDVMMFERAEADDLLGILADGDNTIIVSEDKDLLQIESWHMKLSEPEFVRYVADKEGTEMFFEQCISGDPVDGYYGVPGIGKKKAQKLLRENGYNWTTVVSAYTSAMSPKSKNGKKIESYNLGLTEGDALKTARLAWILKDEREYDKERCKIRLWSPTDSEGSEDCWV